jgi:hypothetical protein
MGSPPPRVSLIEDRGRAGYRSTCRATHAHLMRAQQRGGEIKYLSQGEIEAGRDLAHLGILGEQGRLRPPAASEIFIEKAQFDQRLGFEPNI